MPSGEVRRCDIAHLSVPHKLVESVQRLFNRRQRVEAVHVIDIDIFRLEPLQAAFDLPRQMSPRRTGIVGLVTEGKGCFGRDQKAFARQVLDRLAKNFLGKPLGIDISSVEKIDASFYTEIDEPRSFRHIRLTPRAEKLVPAAEGCRAKAQHRNLQTTSAELSEFHTPFDGPQRPVVATFLCGRTSIASLLLTLDVNKRVL